MRSRTLLLCAAILAGALVALAMIDNNRPWKQLQAVLLDIEHKTLTAELEALRSSQSETLDGLQAAIKTQQDQLLVRRDEIAELEHDLRLFRGKARAASQRQRRLQAKLETVRRQRAKVRAQTGVEPQDGVETQTWVEAQNTIEAQNRVAASDVTVELEQLLRQTRMEIESLDEFITHREASLATVQSDLIAARKALAEARAPIDTLESRLAELEVGPWTPLTRFFTPAASVHQISIPTGTVGGEPHIDRCVTCHLGATRVGFEDDGWPPLLHAHPKPELFVTEDSPHPYTRFGCSSCHGGEGRAIDFNRAGHTPTSNEEAEAWRRAWSWSESSSSELILPLDLTAAACGRCHSDRQQTNSVPELARGQRLLTDLGCFGCHLKAPNDSGRDDISRHPTGPPLDHIAEKTRPDWVYRWLDATPEHQARAHRPDAFGHNQASETPERRAAEIRAVISYLWDTSRQEALAPAPDGDRETGRKLFLNIGCDACHRLDLSPDAAQTRPGPLLAGIGSKVSADWLFAWLLNPRSLHPETTMPNLRLERQEAADLTAFLIEQHDPNWERQTLPTVDPLIRDALLLDLLEQEMTLEASQATLDEMSERQRGDALGERTIRRRGCSGCHRIPGFEDAPSAPRLAELATDLPLQDWLAAAHQPSYTLDEEQTRALTVALLSLDVPTPNHLAAPSHPQAAALQAGRQILERYRCQACHLIEPTTDPTNPTPHRGPAPDLTHTGAKLSAPWLFSYLADPARFSLRPWLTTRMPNFGLSVAERNTLVRYFAARDGRQLLADDGAIPGGLSAKNFAPVDLAVGGVVFNMLQCDSCHGDKSPESGLELQQTPQPAPAYHLARQRLRPDWVVEWILDPHAESPHTAMPANFLADSDTNLDSSFLIGSIHTPIFAVERQRLRRLFASEDELHAFLSDPRRVASALRDYIWTLGE